jgi:hypothetical protein
VEPADRGAIIAAGGVTLAVGFTPAAMVGEVAARISLRLLAEDGSDLPYQPNVVARARVPGSVRSVPGSVLIGAVPLGGQRQATFRIQGTEGAMPPIAALRSSDSLRLAAETVADGNDQVVTLTMRGDAPAGQASGWVDVQFADAVGTVLRVPYLAAIAKPRTDATGHP